MRDGEVVGGQIGGLGVAVDELGVGVVKNLGVAMVLHHDEENMVEVRNARGNGALLSESRTSECGQQSQSGNECFHRGLVNLLERSNVWFCLSEFEILVFPHPAMDAGVFPRNTAAGWACGWKNANVGLLNCGYSSIKVG